MRKFVQEHGPPLPCFMRICRRKNQRYPPAEDDSVPTQDLHTEASPLKIDGNPPIHRSPVLMRVPIANIPFPVPSGTVNYGNNQFVSNAQLKPCENPFATMEDNA